jgi:hypothetical protein
VASSELLERVAHRYGYHWLIVTNSRHSLYRVHIVNAVFFSTIIIITSGSQKILADMYAIGLVASFCINMGSLLIYRYFTGTKEVIPYYTSRVGTLILWIILVSCFIFLAIDKPHGTALWAGITAFVLVAGGLLAKKRSPEIVQIGKSDNEMEMILYMSESASPDLDIIFRRPREESLGNPKDSEVYITFYTPRQGIPPKMAENHFRFPMVRSSLYQRIIIVLRIVEYELPDRHINVHFGWPMSSWLDRLAIGVMVFKLMTLPRKFPQFNFEISYVGKVAPKEK